MAEAPSWTGWQMRYRNGLPAPGWPGHPGHATLFTTADCWVVARSQQTRGKCPALDITVLP